MLLASRSTTDIPQCQQHKCNQAWNCQFWIPDLNASYQPLSLLTSYLTKLNSYVLFTEHNFIYTRCSSVVFAVVTTLLPQNGLVGRDLVQTPCHGSACSKTQPTRPQTLPMAGHTQLLREISFNISSSSPEKIHSLHLTYTHTLSVWDHHPLSSCYRPW